MNGVTSVVGNRDTSEWLAKTFHSTKENKSLLFLFPFSSFFFFFFLGGGGRERVIVYNESF